MILAALRDLQWRWKRFAIAIAATALVFSMSLVMSGLSDSFPAEVHRLLDSLGGRSYLAPAGEVGPFTSASIVPTDQAPDAAPMLFWSAALRVNGTDKQAGLFGLPIGWPLPVDEGRETRGNGEVVVDDSLGLPVGSTLRLGDASYRVVGTMNQRTLFGGQPLVIFTIRDAQARLAGGADITRAFIDTRGPDAPAPSGLTRFSKEGAATDLLRPVKSASSSITFVNILLWLVAICIIGSVVFLSALERSRDFAVFKATGVKGWQMGLGLALQAIALAVVASLFAIVIALLLAPVFPMPVSIPQSAAITLPLIAIGIGLLASLAGLRKTMSADPVQAFGGR
jgi:putative ABC transport system permease protein